MRLGRYRGKHLKPRPKNHAPAALGTAAAIWMSAPAAMASEGHRVRPGETLSGIARRYGTTVRALARANRLSDPNLIVAGTRLRIPGRGGSSRELTTHAIRAGETLSGIAARYNTTVAALARRNHISNPNLIVAGTKLKIPASSPSSPIPEAASRDRIVGSLESQSRAHGLDPSLVKGVAWHESGWHQNAISSAGAIGVMQVMPDTAVYVNEVLGGGRLDVRKADDNVHLGVMYLRHMVSEMGSERKALAAYYSGPGNVRHKLNKGQRAYVRSVEANKRRF